MFSHTIVSIAPAMALALTLTAASDTNSRFQLVASPEAPTAARTTSTSHITATVVDVNGSPIEGAVVVTSAGGEGTSDQNGIAQVVVDGVPSNRHAHVTAIATIDGVNHIGSVPTTLHHRSESDHVSDAGTITLNAEGECNPAWIPTFGRGNADKRIRKLIVFDDGLGDGPAIYAGGSFTVVDDIELNSVARWNGNHWEPVGGGTNDSVFDMMVHDDGSGPKLYVAGNFTMAGGVEANRVAMWDGEQWHPIGLGVDKSVMAMTAFDDGLGDGPALYIGGFFNYSGETYTSHLARWDGEEWSAVGEIGSDTRKYIWAMKVFDDGAGDGPALFIGGQFDEINGEPANNVARWNGVEWSTLGPGLEIPGDTHDFVSVYSFGSFDDGSGDGPALYVGGNFQNAGETVVNGVARWNGKTGTWSALDNGVGTTGRAVAALTVHDDGSGIGPALYAAGIIDSVNGVPVNNIARWDGQQWSPVGGGLTEDVNPQVFSLLSYDDGTSDGPTLYAGGWYSHAEDVEVDGYAAWNGESWSGIGNGIDFRVRAFTVFDDGSGNGPALYVGGWFTIAGGSIVNHVAKWDGVSWSALGSGLNNWVNTMTVFDDGFGDGPALYVGGLFSTAGDVVANRIAKWNGASWSALDSGLNSSVNAMTVFDDGSGDGPALYVGGGFTTAGGAEANRIAKWDGASWSALGSGLGSTVNTMTAFDDGSGDGSSLYVGGSFSTAGGAEANRIAKWDGTNWSSLGSGIDGPVWAFGVFDSGSGGGPSLYVGGLFSTADDVAASNVAAWDGTS